MSFAISDEEKAAGKCLICQSTPLTPTLVIRTDNPVAGAEDTPPAPIEASGQLLAVRAAHALDPAPGDRAAAGDPLPLPRRHARRAQDAGRRQAAHLLDRQRARPTRACRPTACSSSSSPAMTHGQASGWLHGAPIGSAAARPARPLRQLPSAQGRSRAGAVPRRRLRPRAAPRDRCAARSARASRTRCRLILSVRDRSEAFALDALHALDPPPRQLHLPRDL